MRAKFIRLGCSVAVWRGCCNPSDLVGMRVSNLLGQLYGPATAAMVK